MAEVPDAGQAGAPAAAVDEFSLIQCILGAQGVDPDGVCVGPGDDAAVLAPLPGQHLVTAVDTLVEGVHFFPRTPAALVAYRALAVNLSDLAAMGADPGPCLLALTHPGLTADLARAYGEGFAHCALGTGAHLVGGNLSRGPHALSVTVCGWVRPGEALLRSGARPGDLVCVSGRIGAAALALSELGAEPDVVAGLSSVADVPEHLRPYLLPQPRLLLGKALTGLATACIDVSDGLLADLGHLLSASGVGARIELERIPVAGPSADAITAGDDYELLFTLPRNAEDRVEDLGRRGGVPISIIGVIESGEELVLTDAGENVEPPARRGWNHFS